jgi:hypothetical protein
MEGRERGLIWGTISALAWETQEYQIKVTVGIAGIWVEIEPETSQIRSSSANHSDPIKFQ